MPNTSYSQNVGLIAFTGMMSRFVVTCGAIFLIIAGFIPKVGAVIAAMPNSVLGGASVIMFGMIVGAGIKLLSDVDLNRRNMLIIALSLSIGLGLSAVPDALKEFPNWLSLLLKTGLLPAALIAVVLNLVLPEEE
jgi:xanthine/uracil permease